MLSESAKRTLIEAGVAFLVGAVFFSVAFFTQVDFERPYLLSPYSNASFTAAAVLLGVAGLRFATRGGTFDVLGYAGYAFANSLKPRPSERKYKTAYDYQQGMKERRKRHPFIFWPWLLLGGLYLLAAIATAIAYNLV